MRFLNFTFLLAICFLASQATAQVCYDASLGTPTLNPFDPATLDAPLVVTFEFCNDEDALPLDPQGNLRIQVSESRMDPDGDFALPPYFTAAYGFGTWVITQSDVLPAGACFTFEIPYIVTEDAPESNPSIGVNINITPSGLMSGNDNCFTADDDQSDAFTYTIEEVVPVDLISFTATKDRSTSILTWKTVNEINNSHFEVEASNDGTNFRYIGEVQGTNRVDLSTYSFVDEKPANGVNYYRLKQVDLDGRFVHTDVKTVRFDSDLSGRSISVYPNPVVDFVRVDAIGENLTLSIYDATGALVMNNDLISGKDIDTSNLSSGVYTLKVLDNNNELIDTKRIIVSK